MTVLDAACNVGGCLAVGYLLFYLYKCKKPVLVHKKDGYWKDAQIPKVLKERWFPPLLLAISHSENFVYEGIILQSPEVKYKRKFFKSEHDGGIFAVDLLENLSCNNNYDQIVFILPGYTGKSPDPYVKRIARLAFDRKNHNTLVAVICQRGYDGLEISEDAKRLQYAGNLQDHTQILKFLAKTYGPKRTRMVGFSFGGIQSRLLVSKVPKTTENESWYPVAVCLASSPLDLITTTFRQFEGPWWRGGWFYNKVLTKRLGQLLVRHRIATEKEVGQCKTLRELDDQVMGRHWGYKNWIHYYNNVCASKESIANVSVPMLLLNSIDDPLIYDDPALDPWFENSEYAMMAKSYHGGHCAFLTFGWLFYIRKFTKPTYYERLVAQFLDIEF